MIENFKQYVVADMKSKGYDSITTDDVFIVWQCKTLQNWKALLATTVPDGRYYELTFNGDKQETYLDCYVKSNNIAIPLDNQ